MRVVTFQSVLNGIALLLGMVPSRDLNSARAGSITEYINARLLEGWRWDFWPEWTVCEQRYFRPTYDATQNVAAGDELFHIASQTYYQALRAQAPAVQAPATLVSGAYVENSAYWAACAQTYTATSGSTLSDWTTATAYAVGNKLRNPSDGIFYQCITAHTSGASFDATKFGALKAFDKYVAYEQSQAGVALTPMDEVKGVYRRNPRVFTKNPGKLAFNPSDHGVQVDWRAPVVVWVEFRLRPPQFTSTAWSSGTAYTAGQTVYVSSIGECYTALTATTGDAPASSPTKWSKINFPAALSSFVKRAGMADCLKDQKQTDRAVEEIGEAQEELAEACDRALAAQGVFATAEVQTYGS